MEAEHYFKYSQVRTLVSPASEGAPAEYNVSFGWAEAGPGDIDETEPLVYSYHSRSKFASEQDKAWSKSAGTSLASVEDYRKFFNSLAGESPERFLERWTLSEEELRAHWDSKYPNGVEVDQHLFVLKMARMLVEGKKFVMYSRGYKVISPIEDEVEDEGGNET